MSAATAALPVCGSVREELRKWLKGLEGLEGSQEGQGSQKSIGGSKTLDPVLQKVTGHGGVPKDSVLSQIKKIGNKNSTFLCNLRFTFI